MIGRPTHTRTQAQENVEQKRANATGVGRAARERARKQEKRTTKENMKIK